MVNQHWDKILEFLPFSVMAATGWVAHTILVGYKKTGKIMFDTRYMIAGILMSGFVAWCVANLLMAIGLQVDTAGATAAMIGAAGERGWEAVFAKAFQIFGSDEKRL